MDSLRAHAAQLTHVAPEWFSITDVSGKLVAEPDPKVLDFAAEKGLTLIPLSVYAKGSFIKLEMALVRGKKLHDRRADLKKKAEERSMDRQYKIR